MTTLLRLRHWPQPTLSPTLIGSMLQFVIRPKQLWKSSNGYNEDADKCNWTSFKKDLTDSFYQLSKKSKSSMRDLENLVHK